MEIRICLSCYVKVEPSKNLFLFNLNMSANARCMGIPQDNYNRLAKVVLAVCAGCCTGLEMEHIPLGAGGKGAAVFAFAFAALLLGSTYINPLNTAAVFHILILWETAGR